MRTVVVVRPRHPLEGQTLRMLGQMRRHGRLEPIAPQRGGSRNGYGQGR